MCNKIRVLLLVVILGLVATSAYKFYSVFQVPPENVKINIMDEGIEVEIENFKVVHETDGRKEWELKADFAQIDQVTETTRLTNVELTLNQDKNRKIRVSADSGTFEKGSKDVQLQGNVKMVGGSSILRERMHRTSPSASDKNPQPN